MKTLYLIGGTMGVGKTAVCRRMAQSLDRSVFLDGDWCWDANPFQVTEETKRMVIENICFLLNQFIHCSAYETILFCWVMHEQAILDGIVSRLDLAGVDLKCISLICSEQTLRERLRKDIACGKRTADVLDRSIARIPLYPQLNTVKIDTDNRTVREIAEAICRI